MNQKLVHDSLKLLCKKYKEDCGDSFSSLNSYRFDYFFFGSGYGLPLVAKIIDEEPNSEIMGWIVDELQAKGFVAKVDSEFYLTQDGYIQGTKTLFPRLLAILNKNPGIAIIMSSIALIVSIGTLYLRYIEP